ncbi:SDR family NAD(P)-dependent oxidoreductase [Afipia massiliensis]|uniref:SDR family NAD(P)-dependent oxidoreductase n=1 Tax=Afipia massiliensis TaxID=211460 RepID=UPI000AFA4CE1|nr:SDR family oxidoreductase [Afipia massiliensis]
MTDAADARDRITPKIDAKHDLTNLFELSGQVAFVPGGAGGLGEAIAWGLATQGAAVAIGGRDRAKADVLSEALAKAGHRAVAVGMDVTDIPSIERAVAEVAAHFGRIDILVNCVGIQIEQPILEVTEEAFDQVYESSLKAAMFIAQAVAKRQIEAGKGGRQIHLLSVRSQLGLRNRGYSAYCATRGGLVMLVKQHAMELAPHDITVNGVAPTFVYTEMIRHVMENPEFRKQLEARIPLGRIADPKDIVGPTIFFATPASGFVTGQILYVDGGITASQ